MENMEGLKTDRIVEEDIKEIIASLNQDYKKLEGKTILITGGAGFLCSYFLDTISFLNENVFEKQTKIICIDNLRTGKSKNITHLMSKPYFDYINHDISKPLKILGAVDFIIHGASIASPMFYRQFPIETINVNFDGARNMLELAKEKNVRSILVLSTSEVYGDPAPQFIPTNESYHGYVSCVGPRACYDESKRLAETLCMNYFWKHGTPVKVTRTFNTYGPRLHLGDKRVIPDFMKDALHGNPITLLGTGNDTRSFCYISDNITAHFKVLFSDFNGHVFNVGNQEEEISMLNLAERISQLSGNNLPVQKKTSEDKNYTTDNPKRRCPDISKIKEMLKWSPKVSLSEGLKRTIEWHKENSIIK